MAQTISTLQAQTQTLEAKAKALREKLTDARQSLKKAEIQWTEKGELQQVCDKKYWLSSLLRKKKVHLQ
jgi:outer membrane murein-binding lipoprotein Lpp